MLINPTMQRSEGKARHVESLTGVDSSDLLVSIKGLYFRVQYFNFKTSFDSLVVAVLRMKLDFAGQKVQALVKSASSLSDDRPRSTRR